MKKKQAESNPDPVLRRQAIASDVEAFLKSGNKIEQIESGVSAQVNLVAKKPAAQAKGSSVEGKEPSAADKEPSAADKEPSASGEEPSASGKEPPAGS